MVIDIGGYFFAAASFFLASATQESVLRHIHSLAVRCCPSIYIPAACLARIIEATSSFARANSVPVNYRSSFNIGGGRRLLEKQGEWWNQQCFSSSAALSVIKCRCTVALRGTYHRGCLLLGLFSGFIALVTAGHDDL